VLDLQQLVVIQPVKKPDVLLEPQGLSDAQSCPEQVTFSAYSHKLLPGFFIFRHYLGLPIDLFP
jgi:hypothetical protein